VGQHIEQHIQLLAQDPAAKEMVRDAQRTINQLMGELQAYAQRLNEMEQAQAEQQGAGISPEAQAKIISAKIVAENKARIDAAKFQQKQQHTDIKFMSEQERKDAQTLAEIRRKDALTHADVAAKDLMTRADLIHQARQAQLDATVTAADAVQTQVHTAEKHAVDIEAQKKKAAAKPTPTKQ
jgi:hypothetical protein